MRILALASPQRNDFIPNVPTLSEAGVPGFELTGWFALLAPAKTPKEVIDRLTAEVKKAVVDPKFHGRLQAQGLEIIGSTSEEMLAMMKADTKKWGEVIRTTGAKVPQ